MIVYVVSAAVAGDPEQMWQRRAYSDRDAAIEEFSRLTKQHPDVWSTIDVLTVDEHRDWDFRR